VGPKYAKKCVGCWEPLTPLAGGAHEATPDPLVGWGGGTSSPIATPFGAQLLCSQCKILATPLPVIHTGRPMTQLAEV